MRAGSIDLPQQQGSGSGFSVVIVLFLVFLVLKLTPPVNTWSWWWVTAPLWMPVAAAAVCSLIVGIKS